MIAVRSPDGDCIANPILHVSGPPLSERTCLVGPAGECTHEKDGGIHCGTAAEQMDFTMDIAFAKGFDF